MKIYNRRKINESESDDWYTIELYYSFDIKTTDGMYPDYNFTYEVYKKDVVERFVYYYLADFDKYDLSDFCGHYDISYAPYDGHKWFDKWIKIISDPIVFNKILKDDYREIVNLFENDAKQALFDMVKDTPDYIFDIKDIDDIV